MTIGGKPLRDTFEVIGHATAFDYMFQLLQSDSITEQDIVVPHKMFYEKIEKESAGAYRNIAVIISGSNYPLTPVDKIKEEMSDLCKWITDKWENFHP